MFDSFFDADFRTLTTGCLLAIVLGVSANVWRQLIGQSVRGRPLLEWNAACRSNWRSAPEMVVVYVALLWLVSHLVPQMWVALAPQPTTIDWKLVAADSAIKFSLVVVLIIALATSGKSLRESGLTISNTKDQIELGIRGFFATALPMAISMMLTLPIRIHERKHSLLMLLSESGSFSTIALIAVAAVLSTPLLEELLFRVILQGWLSTLFPPAVAISFVAIVFSLVHGWRNGLALLPLALILGYVFYRRQSYLAVVVIHALFNATMLVLQLLNSRTTT